MLGIYSSAYFPGVWILKADVSEPTEGSEMSAFNIQTPGKYPEEYIPHLQHGQSLKTMNYMLLSVLLHLWLAENVSGTNMPIIRSSRLYRWLPHGPYDSSGDGGWRFGAGWLAKCPGWRLLLDYIRAVTFSPDMGIVVPETCSANHKCNKTLSNI
jgi:hypothetical protein